MIKLRERARGAALGALAVTVAAVTAGCVAPSSEPEATAASQLTQLPPPGGSPQVCSQNRYCSFKRATGSEADTSQYPLWARLGSRPNYKSENGPQVGVWGVCA